MMDLMVGKTLDFNPITENLLVGTTPKTSDYYKLKELGVELIINMRAESLVLPFYPRNIIKTVWVPSIDSPLLPIKARFITKAVKHALAIIKKGGKVYVYCMAGRHRSVLMASAILIAQGHRVKDATQLIKNRRVVADPDIPHIHRAIVRFEDFWQQQNKA